MKQSAQSFGQRVDPVCGLLAQFALLDDEGASCEVKEENPTKWLRKGQKVIAEFFTSSISAY
jgi:hypothetical protein